MAKSKASGAKDKLAAEAAAAEMPLARRPQKPATHYTVVATQAMIPGTTEYAKEGDVVTADTFGDMAKLHLERAAIRRSTAEEIEAFEVSKGDEEEAEEVAETEE